MDAESASSARLAAFGVIIAVVAIPVGVLAWLADFGILLWAAGVAVAIAIVMIALGYRQWREDART